jgi:hypothetical protein
VSAARTPVYSGNRGVPESQLRLHVLPLLGRRPAAEITVADVRRLLDDLAVERLVTSAARTDPARSERASRATSAPRTSTTCSPR